ncbi:6-hydroxymethylpterin diphosphokinase MptE-like protein [uncultured Pseudodesulfovibrio sp.]|uniref:6-hydroxymethylpterin diphosphokinase MptE-like protein n=1 Tax=uncultured Pseudodesulfovibrio sp. TaxID=2035858 RepID=UPI0029C8E8B4|nr:6-hydroxymethylpterin diphosphokinase MptE-like protein [uncultured Pseudodesulfovibrio sp.]
MSHRYPCHVGELSSSQWKGQTVFAFGDVRVDKTIPLDKVCRMETPSASASAELLKNLDYASLQDGILFVLPEKNDAIDMEAILETQKKILHIHYKYVYFPNFSHSTQDPLGSRKETIPDIRRSMNQLKNYPWLLNAPIADKLANARIGLPVLLLLPGPSVNEVLPHLKELRKHCLIACIARTIQKCLSAGVEPDIVIQLDTFQVQRHFYAQIPPLPNTLLIPLSISPFYPYAHKFRGVVMMDSFDMNLLPNPARLRESYVSTLTACLGLAEALWAPEAYVAGVDLSFEGDAASHPYGEQHEGIYPLANLNGNYLLSTRDGRLVQSKDWYIATSSEADQFVREIRKTSGTRFYSTTDSTLLSKEFFPFKGMKELLALPEIDREQYRSTIDSVLEQRENVDMVNTRKQLITQLADAREVARAYRMRNDPGMNDILETSMMTKVAQAMRDAVFKEDVDAIGVAARLAKKWEMELNTAFLFVRGMTNVQRGKPIPVLCLPRELPEIREKIGRILPEARLAPHTVAEVADPAYPEITVLHSHHLMKWLVSNPVVFASPGMADNFSYVLELSPSDNIYDLLPIVGRTH